MGKNRHEGQPEPELNLPEDFEDEVVGLLNRTFNTGKKGAPHAFESSRGVNIVLGNLRQRLAKGETPFLVKRHPNGKVESIEPTSPIDHDLSIAIAEELSSPSFRNLNLGSLSGNNFVLFELEIIDKDK